MIPTACRTRCSRCIPAMPMAAESYVHDVQQIGAPGPGCRPGR